MEHRNDANESPIAILGSAGASPGVSGASPETENISYSKRRLPHFERPWSKYAIAFSTRARTQLVPHERDIVLASILFGLEHRQYELFAACVMPDHVHLLIEPQPKELNSLDRTVFWSLSKILHGIKSATSHRINKTRRTSNNLWETESFDRLIRSERDLQEKFRYSCRNPWQFRVVAPDEDYSWLWTPECCSAGAPISAAEAAALPRQPETGVLPRQPEAPALPRTVHLHQE